MAPMARKLPVTVYLWIALGAIVGWAATAMTADKAFMTKVESIASGMFGAAIGGQLQVTFSAAVVPPASVQVATLLGALVGSVAMMLLLAAFRGAIGPLKPTRAKRSAR